MGMNRVNVQPKLACALRDEPAAALAVNDPGGRTYGGRDEPHHRGDRTPVSHWTPIVRSTPFRDGRLGFGT